MSLSADGGSFKMFEKIEECTCQFWSCCLCAFTFQARKPQTSLEILPLVSPHDFPYQRCRTLQEAALEDTELVTYQPPKNGGVLGC